MDDKQLIENLRSVNKHLEYRLSDANELILALEDQVRDLEAKLDESESIIKSHNRSIA